MLLLAIFLLAGTVIVARPGEADSAPPAANGHGRAKHRIQKMELGASKARMTPDCPSTLQRVCSVEGRVTGFQALSAGSRNRPFVAHWKGRVVSWSITLSNPRRKAHVNRRTNPPTTFGPETPVFNDFFGKPATARISVLKPVKRRNGHRRFKLVRQGPTQILNRYFGSRVRFVLTHPLTVMRGQVVALTIPTWAPAFWHNRGCDLLSDSGAQRDPAACARSQRVNTWRGSRPRTRCSFSGSEKDKKAQAEKSHPQQKVGSVKNYDCYYRGSRLLYTASVVRRK